VLLTARDLLHAWERLAAKLDTEYGGDDTASEQIQANPQAWCGALAQRIAGGQYQPQPLQPIGVPKKSGGQRLLLVPHMLDRLVHSALAQRLSDQLDAGFSPHSYAYRPGTGVQQACESLRKHLDRNDTGWVLDADILDCFNLVDHQAVIEQLTQHGVWQNQTAWHLRQYLHSQVNPAPQLGLHGPSCLVRGLPQGSPLSPLLCNVVLNVLDQTLQTRGIHFVRYADDFVVLASDQDSITQIRELIQNTLAPLGLQLHPDKTRIQPSAQGFDFLGQHFTPPEKPQAPDTSDQPSTEAEQPPPPQAPDKEDAQNDPLLRTLYLLEPHTTLDRESHQLLVLTPEQAPLKIPAERLHQVMAFGSTNITSGAISLCLEMGIPVMLLSGRGRYFGLIDPLKIDNLNTQRAQFRALDLPSQSLTIASSMVQGKLTNQLALLRRWHRHRPPADVEHTKDLYDALQTARRKAAEATSTDSLRGIEGAAAAAYWRAIKALLSPTWKFEGRRRQPPPDPVNSLLSYGYTLMYYNLLTLVAARGLNPYAGFLHTPRSGHHALVSDLMEEFRGPIVDALVMDMVQNGRIKPDEFSWPEGPDEPCSMSVSARRNFVHAFEKKLNAPQRHTRYGLHMDWRRIMDGQVLHLVQTLHGQSHAYQAYTITP
jgi:CRISPR-associated protein Cas1